MQLRALIFLLFFLLSLFWPADSFAWLKYAVALKSTGTVEGDQQEIARLRRLVIKEALRHRGKPYVWGANGPYSFDCSGFVRAVYRKFGVDLPRVSYDQGKAGAPIKRSLKHLLPGDLIYFKQNRRGWPHHVAIYIDRGFFIHCTSTKGVVVENFKDSHLRNSVKFISRIFFTREESQYVTSVLGTGTANQSAAKTPEKVTPKLADPRTSKTGLLVTPPTRNLTQRSKRRTFYPRVMP